jgi:hypothetical protein
MKEHKEIFIPTCWTVLHAIRSAYNTAHPETTYDAQIVEIVLA